MNKRTPLAFTLVEMLTVLAVIVVMIAVVAPAAIQTLRGSNMSQSGEMINDQFVLARQAAITSSRPVQMRFYRLPVVSADNPLNFCAVQSYRQEESGRLTPLTKLQELRTNVVFAQDNSHSTLIDPQTGTSTPDLSATGNWSVTGQDNLPAYNNQPCAYVGFYFRPDGSTDLDPTPQASRSGFPNGGWFVTLVAADSKLASNQQPPNYYTLRVEPLNGHVRIYRP